MDFIFISNLLTSIIVGYLVGCISFSAIWAKFYNIDLSKIGSKNIGATNLSRAIGWKKTLIPAIADGVKCFIVFLILKYLFDFYGNVILIGMVFSAIGHIWPFWNNFYGGKGVAVSIGYMFAIVPIWYWVLIVILFIFIVKKLKIMTYASMFFLTSLLLGSIIFKGNFFHIWSTSTWFQTFALVLIVVFKHRKNFIRIINKKELKN